MSGYRYSSGYNYHRPPQPPQQSRQPPAPPPGPPQYGHQTYTPHAYQNVPPAPYMQPYNNQYMQQPYPQQPSYGPDTRGMDYPNFPSQPAPPGQPGPGPGPGPVPASGQTDQYSQSAPGQPGGPMYSPWGSDRSASAISQQSTRGGFDETHAREEAARTFRRFDVDGGGYLDLQEFMDALRSLHLGIAYHDALECFRRCDENEDGRISEDEFVRVYIEEMSKRQFAMAYHQPAASPPPMRP